MYLDIVFVENLNKIFVATLTFVDNDSFVDIWNVEVNWDECILVDKRCDIAFEAVVNMNSSLLVDISDAGNFVDIEEYLSRDERVVIAEFVDLDVAVSLDTWYVNK